MTPRDHAAGANAAIFKPIDVGQLADCAAEIGLGWQLHGRRHETAGRAAAATRRSHVPAVPETS